VNITAACLNDCLFCIKRDGSRFYGSDLALNGRPPLPAEIMADFAVADKGQRIKEVVFCGMGEPLLRYDCVVDVCRCLRERRGQTLGIRVDTSGLAWNKDKRLDILDWLDILSISLNAESAEKYEAMCKPKIADAYGVLMDFLRAVKAEELRRKEQGLRFPLVRLSVVDTREADCIPESGRNAFPPGQFPVPDFEKCKEIAAEFGWPLITKVLFRDSRDDRWTDPALREMCLQGTSPDCCKDCTYRH
jgi:TatD family-associated radical SAM protein